MATKRIIQTEKLNGKHFNLEVYNTAEKLVIQFFTINRKFSRYEKYNFGNKLNDCMINQLFQIGYLNRTTGEQRLVQFEKLIANTIMIKNLLQLACKMHVISTKDWGDLGQTFNSMEKQVFAWRSSTLSNMKNQNNVQNNNNNMQGTKNILGQNLANLIGNKR